MQTPMSKNKSKRVSRRFGQCNLSVARIMRVYVAKHAISALGNIRLQDKHVDPLSSLDYESIDHFFSQYKPEWDLSCKDDLHVHLDGLNPDPDIGQICSIAFVLYELHHGNLQVCGFMSARLYQNPGPYETCWWGENILVHPSGESGCRMMLRLVMNYLVSIDTPWLYLQVDPSNRQCLGALQ